MMNLTKKQANEERIRIAITAIENMPDLDDLETGIIDMMTNLMHLAASNGISVKAVAGVAMMHWEAER